MAIHYPYPNQSKVENLAYGKSIVEAFCDFNEIKVPAFVEDNKLNANGMYYWGKHRLLYNIKRCRTPINVPGFAWSYTGYKSDMTVAGVLAHEFGHYIDDIHKNPSKRIKKAIGTESCVTSYEPNLYEIFAEAFRVFVLNPNLLQIGRPRRYNYFIELGLKPVVLDDWEYVLGNAHPKIISAAKSWLKR
jgi:hypothetical protein